MIEAGAPSTGDCWHAFRGARPTEGSHTRTTGDLTQRFMGAKRRAAPRRGAQRRGQGHYRGRDPVEPRPGQSGCSSPRCLILCAVVALMCLRARGGRSSITRWSSASVSRTSTHSSAYCASLASPISSICRSLSSIALLWLGVGTPRRIPRPARGSICT
jgi:hypothetical protein